ncbi:hypothetical protein MKW94_029155 [Papaver nudicaule]|uniref:Uncharacterized protein n=1 Tax=Papaver nudicaule TaxID=74823 RepID=A0AA41UXJ8_PAPNU|nr:hypothetical protein [Papaver nudicaule]
MGPGDPRGPGGPGWGPGPGWAPASPFGGGGPLPGPFGILGGVGNGLCNLVSSCLSCLCCCWLLQDCFGGPGGPPAGPIGAPPRF